MFLYIVFDLDFHLLFIPLEIMFRVLTQPLSSLSDKVTPAYHSSGLW